MKKILLWIVPTLLLLTPLIYNFVPIKKGLHTFYLANDNYSLLIDTLKTHGYSVSFLDKIMLRPFNSPPKGWYCINDIPNKRFSFFNNFQKYKTKTIRIKIYAGENSIELNNRLANDLDLNATILLDHYQKQSTYLEGDIFSGFYQVSTKADEKSIIHALFAMSNQKRLTFTKEYCHSHPNELEFKILLTIASIIQKETNDPKEMPLISSVIENRLDKKMRLQMDASLNYKAYSHTAITPMRIKEDQTYYNTYKHGGIPPTPLSTVSIEALTSALHPAETDYLYFMVNHKGKHDFSTTYKEHKKYIKAFKKIRDKLAKKKHTSIQEANTSQESTLLL